MSCHIPSLDSDDSGEQHWAHDVEEYCHAYRLIPIAAPFTAAGTQYIPYFHFTYLLLEGFGNSASSNSLCLR